MVQLAGTNSVWSEARSVTQPPPRRSHAANPEAALRKAIEDADLAAMLLHKQAHKTPARP